jgi:hypothetical protein
LAGLAQGSYKALTDQQENEETERPNEPSPPVLGSDGTAAAERDHSPARA